MVKSILQRPIKRLEMSEWFFILLIAALRDIDAFEVQAPQPRVVAVYDQPVVLGCVFPPSLDPGAPLKEDLVVTWQRVEDLRVVHSFYYGTDQLAHQSGEYHNRTGLFHSQLPGGNASLRLESVGPGDQGRYLCSVNNMKGTGKAEVQLKYAAFYTEPHLTVQAQHSYMTFLYETEGYPEPEVRWLDPNGHNLTHNISVTQSSRAPGLLLSLRTQLVMQAGGAVNYTFSLRNQLLEQVMERSLSYESSSRIHADCPRDRSTLLMLVIPAGGLAIFLIFLYLRRQRTWKATSKSQNRTEITVRKQTCDKNTGPLEARTSNCDSYVSPPSPVHEV
ncbi:CD276 antigen-like [Salvelinus fontinalis]|uniref:CD276 antigen-like n=1 Tax=Salvelinus fontinalis TaxID=8038 RepID=UPI002486697E|nr:CD276 antigen-like [Salvelinus fontinalis]